MKADVSPSLRWKPPQANLPIFEQALLKEALRNHVHRSDYRDVILKRRRRPAAEPLLEVEPNLPASSGFESLALVVHRPAATTNSKAKNANPAAENRRLAEEINAAAGEAIALSDGRSVPISPRLPSLGLSLDGGSGTMDVLMPSGSQTVRCRVSRCIRPNYETQESMIQPWLSPICVWDQSPHVGIGRGPDPYSGRPPTREVGGYCLRRPATSEVRKPAPRPKTTLETLPDGWTFRGKAQEGENEEDLDPRRQVLKKLLGVEEEDTAFNLLKNALSSKDEDSRSANYEVLASDAAALLRVWDTMQALKEHFRTDPTAHRSDLVPADLAESSPSEVFAVPELITAAPATTTALATATATETEAAETATATATATGTATETATETATGTATATTAATATETATATAAESAAAVFKDESSSHEMQAAMQHKVADLRLKQRVPSLLSKGGSSSAASASSLSSSESERSDRDTCPSKKEKKKKSDATDQGTSELVLVIPPNSNAESEQEEAAFQSVVAQGEVSPSGRRLILESPDPVAPERIDSLVSLDEFSDSDMLKSAVPPSVSMNPEASAKREGPKSRQGFKPRRNSPGKINAEARATSAAYRPVSSSGRRRSISKPVTAAEKARDAIDPGITLEAFLDFVPKVTLRRWHRRLKLGPDDGMETFASKLWRAIQSKDWFRFPKQENPQIGKRTVKLRESQPSESPATGEVGVPPWKAFRWLSILSVAHALPMVTDSTRKKLDFEVDLQRLALVAASLERVESQKLCGGLAFLVSDSQDLQQDKGKPKCRRGKDGVDSDWVVDAVQDDDEMGAQVQSSGEAVLALAHAAAMSLPGKQDAGETHFTAEIWRWICDDPHTSAIMQKLCSGKIADFVECFGDAEEVLKSALSSRVRDEVSPGVECAPLALELLLQKACASSQGEADSSKTEELVGELVWHIIGWDSFAGRRLIKRLSRIFFRYTETSDNSNKNSNDEMSKTQFQRLCHDVGWNHGRRSSGTSKGHSAKNQISQIFDECVKSNAEGQTADFVEFLWIFERVVIEVVTGLISPEIGKHAGPWAAMVFAVNQIISACSEKHSSKSLLSSGKRPTTTH